MKDLAAAVLSLVLLGSVWFLLAWHQSDSKKQPVPYNHKKHIELGLECANCHAGIAEGGVHATLPPLETCASCHNQDTDNPKLKVVQAYILENREIPWNQIYRVPQHVYFSHRRHVGIAKLDCAVCHGDMSKREVPVTRQVIPIKMERCMDCHRRRKVTNDCLACHL
ncbi:MAG: cytochrome c3 family protein [Elusimicrobia bacterium]|nr:cytochrome c3 family protein [Elusimicrobiota bacterium]